MEKKNSMIRQIAREITCSELTYVEALIFCANWFDSWDSWELENLPIDKDYIQGIAIKIKKV